MPGTVVRTEPQRESVAELHLTRAGFETYLPRIATTRGNGHGCRTVQVPLFPTYAFVRIGKRWYSIQSTIGVMQVLKSGEQPAMISEAVIEELRGRERDGLIVLPPPPRPRLRCGDAVRITRGAFRDQVALYQGMRSRQRIEVLMTLLGGTRQLTLPRGAVLPLR